MATNTGSARLTPALADMVMWAAVSVALKVAEVAAAETLAVGGAVRVELL